MSAATITFRPPVLPWALVLEDEVMLLCLAQAQR